MQNEHSIEVALEGGPILLKYQKNQKINQKNKKKKKKKKNQGFEFSQSEGAQVRRFVTS